MTGEDSGGGQLSKRPRQVRDGKRTAGDLRLSASTTGPATPEGQKHSQGLMGIVRSFLFGGEAESLAVRLARAKINEKELNNELKREEIRGKRISSFKEVLAVFREIDESDDEDRAKALEKQARQVLGKEEYEEARALEQDMKKLQGKGLTFSEESEPKDDG